MSREKGGSDWRNDGYKPRGRQGYQHPTPNIAQGGGAHSHTRRESHSPPPPYEAPAYPPQGYNASPLIVQNPPSSVITVAVTQLPLGPNPTQGIPQSHYPRQDIPQSHYPRQDIDIPQGHYPRQDIPQSNYPRQDIQQGHYPRQDIPQGHYPRQDIPQSHYPRQDIPQGHYPRQDIPQSHYPRQDIPQSHYPRQDIDIPQGHYPRQDVQQSNYPRQDIPQSHYPRQDIPQSHYPRQDIPQSHFSRQDIPQSHYPGKDMPQSHFPTQHPPPEYHTTHGSPVNHRNSHMPAPPSYNEHKSGGPLLPTPETDQFPAGHDSRYAGRQPYQSDQSSRYDQDDRQRLQKPSQDARSNPTRQSQNLPHHPRAGSAGQQNRSHLGKDMVHSGQEKTHFGEKNASFQTAPPSYEQQAPGRNKERVYELPDGRKSHFQAEEKFNKGGGTGRKHPGKNNNFTRSRLNSASSTTSDASTTSQGGSIHFNISKKPEENIEAMGSSKGAKYKEKRGREGGKRGKVNHVSGNLQQAPVSDGKGLMQDDRAKQGFRQMPLERRASDASSPESVASEVPENQARKKTSNRNRNKKAFKKSNKEKFQSMPDLNLEAGSSRPTAEDLKSTDSIKDDNKKTKAANSTEKKAFRNRKNNNAEVNQENPDMFSSSCKVKATLEIGLPFPNVDSLKDKIRENIELPVGNSSLQFINDSIICAERHSVCTIIVTTTSKQQCKHLIKSLYVNLRKDLKTKVQYSMCGVEDTQHKMESSLAVKDKPKRNHFSRVDNFSRRSIRKRVTKILEMSDVENEKAEAARQMAPSSSIARVDGDVPADTTADNGSGKSEMHFRMADAAKIFVRINKIFPRKEDIHDLVLSIVKNKASLIKLIPDSIVITTSQTLCQIEVSNKDVREIVELLNAFQFQNVRLHCIVEKNDTDTQKDTSVSAEHVQKEIERGLEEINKKTRKILDMHEKKIVSLDDALKAMSSPACKDGSESDSLDEDYTYEELALIDKLVEVTKQKDTFCCRIDQLMRNLRELQPMAATTLQDVSRLLQSAGVECERLKTALPIYARREDIVRQISENQVSVILGETGSGKSTQMVQYLYEAGLAGQGLIVCTQPRKVAAVTLAERVAKEMAGNIGGLVGYKTGMKKNTQKETKIVFATDHCLLNECLTDPILSKYSCIIVDEAHERSIYTDLLLGMIKKCLQNRPDLKVVITSATIDPEVFIRYFRCGRELRVSGRTFPVEVVYSKMDDSPEFENFEMKAVKKAVDVHRSEEAGDILVFLTSPVEIMRCCEEFENLMKGKSDFQCFPLHGQLLPEEQKKVFQTLSKGKRKIVFATNCAETSITIDGIKYVIDTGVAKEMRYDGKKNICMLGTFVISKSSANQRKGRAGRTASGKCYRLYSEDGYRNMEESSQPEILRVPLGQSVLKLAELGVNVQKYDFVQPPSPEAIEAALATLRELGALSSDGITDIGRWIAKLPLSPKEGVLVYHGYKNGVLYDSLVLASLIANGSNLFYKGMTESEAQASAKSKSEFGSVYGDIFTWLDVYKSWVQIPHKKQSEWCKRNSINNKAIHFTQQFVNDMASVLKNELKVEIEKTFSSDESTVALLRKVLFDTNVTSVSHFLGHARAGYYTLVTERQVHVHPSSTLLTYGSHPEWVVYTEFTKTSRDFIRGITVVEEEWVLEAARDGRLPVDINTAKQIKSVLSHREMVGSSVFRKLTGARYSQLRVWEDTLATVGMKAVVVEADCELGTLDIFSTSPIKQEIVDTFTTVKQEVVNVLTSEEIELSIFRKGDSEPSGIRIMLGQGGCVRSLLLPNQSNTILIKKSGISTTEEVIRAKFAAYGAIKECVQFKRSDPWGFVRYGTYVEAQAAVDQTRNDEENCAVLKIDKQFKKFASKFEARLTWCRRPIKGKGTAFIKCPPIERAGLIGKTILLPVGFREIRLSKKGDELICFETGNANEMDIKAEIMKLLDYDESLNQNIHVTVCREKTERLSHREANRIKTDLYNAFAKYVDRDKFSINVMMAKGNPVNQVAFIHFENPVGGFQACSNLQGNLVVDSQLVTISPRLKTTIHVSEAIMKVCKSRFDEIIKGLEMYKETEVHIRPLKQGDYAFDITSDNVKSMVEARDLLQKELEGEILDCTANNIVRKCLKPQGKETLKKIASVLDVLIVANDRRERIHIYGTVAKVNAAQMEINKYLSKLAEGKQVDIYLREQGKPPGLLKQLMKKYNDLHDDIIQEFSVTDVVIDFKQQKLSIFGPADCVDRAVASISELEKSLLRPGLPQQEKWMPDCVTCMCPVDHKSQLYRLEACGHCYCLSCLKLQITVSVQDKIFPIVCTEAACKMPLVCKDISFCIQKKWITEEKLLDRSVNAFVTSNPDRFKFCLTAECPVIYEVTTDKAGVEFNCPSCFLSLCTTCHTAYHPGLACQMAAVEEEVERQVNMWVMANPKQRKRCPKCKVGVEKIEGCNKMRCAACHTYFCWVCLEIAADEQKCYAHLGTKHGGFYDHDMRPYNPLSG